MEEKKFAFSDNGIDMTGESYESIHDETEYVNKEEFEAEMMDPEKRKEFIRGLKPETKANLVYEELIKSGEFSEVYGHNKRIVMRKLIREAKAGKLDKIFLEKNQ